jgi:lipopolysaccharide transport system permease protein
MKQFDWDLTVSSKQRLFDFKLRELLHYRDLIYMFFIRDFVTVYKQTILGPLWYIISPLCSTLVYAFVFGNLAGMGTNGIPFLLFYFSGTMLWSYFSNCLNSASLIFISNAGVLGKVYFPRLSLPLATTFASTCKMLIQFILLMVFLIYYITTGSSVRPSLYALFFPFIIIWLGLLGTGLGMIVSALTTKYRDLTHLLALVLSLAMYVTPVVYPLSQVPQKFAFFFYMNPLSAPIELFRILFYGAGELPNQMIVSSLGMTMVIILLGLVLFTKYERTFLDVI